MAFPLLHSPPYFCFIHPHHGWRHWRKAVRGDSSAGWVSGCATLPTHCDRLEGKGRPPIQAMQDHFSTRWTLLRFSWTGRLGAPLDDGHPGLSGQTPLCYGQVWAWSCDSQGAEKWNRPVTVRHQDHRPGDREVRGQPGGARVPPVAHADGNQGRRQGPLPWFHRFPPTASLDLR